jgi:hypothetical protein
VWNSVWQDGSYNGVFGARVSAQGTPGAEFRVNSYTSHIQNFPAVAADGNGNIVAAWHFGQMATPTACSASASRWTSSSGTGSTRPSLIDPRRSRSRLDGAPSKPQNRRT